MQSPLIKLALDLGPLMVFFAAFQWGGIYLAVELFMVATIVALALGYMRERRLAPMPIFSAVLVLIFGGLTLYLKNDTFIKVKLTILYGFLGALLLGGLLYKRMFIKYVFGEAFDLDEAGWRKLTWRWAFFAFAIAALNEFVWRNYPTRIWVDFKVWGIMPLVFVFALAQAPLVLKHDNTAAKKGDT